MTRFNRREFLKVCALGLTGSLISAGVAHADGDVGDADDHIAMLYDSTMCVGCNACTMACRQWNETTAEVDPEGLYDAPKELTADTWTLIQLYQDDETSAFVKRQCMHCLHPACVSGCPVHALEKTESGAVTYDAARCIGCRYCMYTCPYHVPRFEWDEVLPVIAKCTLCYDRIQVGEGPYCAELCPTGALVWGRRGDLIAEAESRLAANPDRYVNHIYGKDEAGGTSVLYLADVEFENLGLEPFDPEPITDLSEETGNIVIPAIIFGGPLVLAAIRSASKRGAWEETWPL